MRPVVDKPLSIRDFDLWVLSKALKEDLEKYQEGLKHLENAKKNAKRFWIFRKLEGGRSSQKAVSLLEQALSREISFYPQDYQQIFLLTESRLREKGFTTGYNFKDQRLVPFDGKLEIDLEKLSYPSTYPLNLFFDKGYIDIKQKEGKISPYHIIKAGSGKNIIWDVNMPLSLWQYFDLVEYRILQFTEKSERTDNQLRQKMGNYIDELSAKINEYGSLATRADGIKELYSLSTANKLAIPWQEAMKQVEVKA
jgi:hypothetical protein